MTVFPEVAFGGGKGKWKILAYYFGFKAGLRSKVSCVNHFCLCNDNGAKICTVQVLDKVAFGGHGVGTISA